MSVVAEPKHPVFGPGSPPTEHFVRWFLTGLVHDVMLTGSRAICAPLLIAPTSDWDFVAQVSDLKEAADRLIAHGFEASCSMSEDADGVVVTSDTMFVSLKLEALNIIAVVNRDFFEKFGLATRTATRLGLTSKSERVLLFQAILYGKG
jgi:hypothetical protein